MKPIFLFALFFINILLSNAQDAKPAEKRTAKDGRLAVYLEGEIPVDNNIHIYDGAIGLGFRGELNLGKITALTASISYQSYDLALLSNDGVSWHAVPLMIGIKVYGKSVQNGFYGQMQGGVTSLVSTNRAYHNSGSFTYSYVTYGPGFGYHLDNLDLNLNYFIMKKDFFSSSAINLRIAFVFGS